MKVVGIIDKVDKIMKMNLLALMFFLFFSQSSYAKTTIFDPSAKLKEADYMLSIDRPLAADKLINNVIISCNKKSDEICLATALFYYGKSLMGRVPEEYDYQKNAIRRILSYIDKDVIVGNVNQKSMEYFEKALILAKKHEINDLVSAIYVKIGILQFKRFKDRVSACGSFDLSLEYHLLFKKNNPNDNVILENGFESFKEYISKGKVEMGCVK